MDGGGRCQQSRLGRLGTDDRDCSCPFCTDGRLESKLGECSRCANREPSTSAVAPGGSRSQCDVRADSVPVKTNSSFGEGDRALRGQVSNRNSEVGQFYLPNP